MSSIYDQMQSFRAALIARDTAAVEFLVNEYSGIHSRLVRTLDAVNSQISQARQAGQEIPASWQWQRTRYQSFLSQLDSEFQRFGGTVQVLVENRRIFEAQQATSDAASVIAGVNGSFNRLNAGAIQNIAASLRSTSPLGKLLEGFGSVAFQHVAGVLRDAVALGHNPRKIAGQVRDSLGVPIHRALLISRTESNRAYRQATIQTYQQSDLVTGWRWVASKSSRTCLACLALDGTFFPKDKPFPAHPACRCTMVPAIDGEQPSKRESAGDWFERQPDDVKQKMMSGVAFDAYKAGKVTLKDFIGKSTSRKWGPMRYERSLKEILQNS